MFYCALVGRVGRVRILRTIPVHHSIATHHAVATIIPVVTVATMEEPLELTELHPAPEDKHRDYYFNHHVHPVAMSATPSLTPASTLHTSAHLSVLISHLIVHRPAVLDW